jgi:hypothetical protein
MERIPRDQVLDEFRSNEQLSPDEKLYAEKCIEFFFTLINIFKVLRKKGFEIDINVQSIFDFDAILEWLKTQRENAEAHYTRNYTAAAWFDAVNVSLRYIRMYEVKIEQDRLKLLQNMISKKMFPENRLGEEVIDVESIPENLLEE